MRCSYVHNKYIYPVTKIKTLNVAQGLIEIESNSNDTNSLHLLNVYCVRPYNNALFNLTFPTIYEKVLFYFTDVEIEAWGK